ncbi:MULTISPECIES: DNA-3-methyladenine glycosylase I [Clostridium]|uniref:DNA-3-methyladenine glycosylase I n=1 Tax=Clostridium TaxID=1485 RepID=UPI00069E7FDB|nr:MULTISPECIES: DNA-3-methyladenine glycosylase I [Clostridium]KOF56277.1 3-methyladenine DNA glycosylase [Clostridium sp. DMHC 10]MCD2348267.1 DNA-3-methyladenine glycosylase I [Clostridium guangxiense]
MDNCAWPGKNQTMQEYHDKEWCVSSYDDRYIFEMLSLEGAQAGLSWNTVLSKREEYKKAFNNFDIVYCSKLSDEELEEIRQKYAVIKNKLKLKSVRNNALEILKIQDEFGSFSNYLWKYVDFKPIINNWKSEAEVPAETELSQKISKDLKKRNFKFVGPLIIYSFMQAIGMIDDHIISCQYHSFNIDEHLESLK